jgi:hypothetical protein
MQRASFFFITSKEAQERKNTSLDASSEGASDGPTKETSKEAKLHGLWQCPLQCVFGVLSFRDFSLDASQTQQYFGAYLFSTPSRTPRGKSIIPSRLSPLRNTHILSNSSLPLNPTKHQKVGQTYFSTFTNSPSTPANHFPL